MLQYRDKKKTPIVVCPHCGYEYLPAEIYLPKVFFGQPEDIDRTSDGKIEVYEGSCMDLTEEYVCDHCGTTFKVDAVVKFKTTEKEDKDSFDPIWVSSLFPPKISMPEPIEDVDVE